jgi:hypothetical protein
MSFVIDYFFGDYKLASLLFNWQDAMKSTDDLETYVKAIEYYIFGERLNQLVVNVSEYVDQYERYAVQHQPGQIFILDEARNHPSYHNFSPKVEENINMGLAYGSVRSMHIMSRINHNGPKTSVKEVTPGLASPSC